MILMVGSTGSSPFDRTWAQENEDDGLSSVVVVTVVVVIDRSDGNFVLSTIFSETRIVVVVLCSLVGTDSTGCGFNCSTTSIGIDSVGSDASNVSTCGEVDGVSALENSSTISTVPN